MYSIYFRALIKSILPAFLRKNAMLSLLFAFVKPLQTLNDNVIVPWRYRNRRAILFDGQTIRMEKMLNDEYLLPYDPIQRNNDITLSAIIYIETTSDDNVVYLYNDIEARPPIYLFNDSEGETPTYLYNDSETLLTLKFIVWVPNLLGGTYETSGTDDYEKIVRLIDTFRIAGNQNYMIKRY